MIDWLVPFICALLRGIVVIAFLVTFFPGAPSWGVYGFAMLAFLTGMDAY